MRTRANDGAVDDARRLHNQLWCLPSHTTHCPYPTPVSLGRDDIPTLLATADGYVATTKTDGERCTVVLGSREGDPSTTFAFRFDRSGRPTRMRIARADTVKMDEDPAADVCEGTLLDAEWMGDRGELVLLDVVACCGYGLRPLDDFRRRMRFGAAVAAAVDLLDDDGHGVRITTKPFVALGQIASLDHGDRADGIVFMPTREPLRTGRVTSMFKWKPSHTVDALFHEGRMVFGQGAGVVEASELGVWIEGDAEADEGTVYEIGPGPRGTGEGGGDGETGAPEEGEIYETRFEVLHPRPDKDTPNQVDTVVATLRHMSEGLDFDELVRLIHSG